MQIFSKSARQSNFYYTGDDINIKRLCRSSDFLKYYYATYKRSYSFINSHTLVSTGMELDFCLSELERKTFRAYSIVSLNFKCICLQPKAYELYEPSQRHFPAGSPFPTHPDYQNRIVRWISLGSPYGDTYIIDATKMNKAMLHKLLDFLHKPSTIVCGWNLTHDNWAFHLTFGIRSVAYSEYNVMSNKEKETCRRNGILQNLRLFDLMNVIGAVKTDQPGYNGEEWKHLGILPEGATLWHLAQSVLGLDLVGNDSSALKKQGKIWNNKTLTPLQFRYIQVDAQIRVLTFIALLRYRLIPEACQIIMGYPHDYRTASSFVDDVESFSKDDNQRHVQMFDELKQIVNCRDGIWDLQSKVPLLCIASSRTTQMIQHLKQTIYQSAVYPILAKSATSSSSDDVHNEGDVDTTAADNEVDEMTFMPGQAAQIDSVPGDLPYFVSATHPRLRTEVVFYLQKMQERIMLARQTGEFDAATIDKMCTLNWLDKESTRPLETLVTLMQRYPLVQPKKRECNNCFAVSYPIFQTDRSLTPNEVKFPSRKLLALPGYAHDPYLYFGPFIFSVELQDRDLANKEPWSSEDPYGNLMENIPEVDPGCFEDSSFTSAKSVFNNKPAAHHELSVTRLDSDSEYMSREDLLMENAQLKSQLADCRAELGKYMAMCGTSSSSNFGTIAETRNLFSSINGRHDDKFSQEAPTSSFAINKPISVARPDENPYPLYINDKVLRGCIVTDQQLEHVHASLLDYQVQFDFYGRYHAVRRKFMGEKATSWLCEINDYPTVEEMVRIFFRCVEVAKRAPSTLTPGMVETLDQSMTPLVNDVMHFVRTGVLFSGVKSLEKRRRKQQQISTVDQLGEKEECAVEETDSAEKKPRLGDHVDCCAQMDEFDFSELELEVVDEINDDGDAGEVVTAVDSGSC